MLHINKCTNSKCVTKTFEIIKKRIPYTVKCVYVEVSEIVIVRLVADACMIDWQLQAAKMAPGPEMHEQGRCLLEVDAEVRAGGIRPPCDVIMQRNAFHVRCPRTMAR